MERRKRGREGGRDGWRGRSAEPMWPFLHFDAAFFFLSLFLPTERSDFLYKRERVGSLSGTALMGSSGSLQLSTSFYVLRLVRDLTLHY